VFIYPASAVKHNKRVYMSKVSEEVNRSYLLGTRWYIFEHSPPILR